MEEISIMNIFVVDSCPIKAARCLCDTHVVKMTLECAQILCTVSWMQGVSAPYRPTHMNHQIVLWANRSLSNYKWLMEHAFELCKEYELRYGKIHKCKTIIWWCKTQGAKPEDIGLTPFIQCMPEQYRGKDAIEAYRRFYLEEKRSIATWSKIKSRMPDWWNNIGSCPPKQIKKDCLKRL